MLNRIFFFVSIFINSFLKTKLVSGFFHLCLVNQFLCKLGNFVYYDIPENAFPVGIEYWGDGDRSYPIASAAKAVCDKLSKMPPTRSYTGLEALMFEDLRFDEDAILELDARTILDYASLYHCTTLRTLGHYLQEHS